MSHSKIINQEFMSFCLNIFDLICNINGGGKRILLRDL